MTKCDICDSTETLDLEFGIDETPFNLCEECYNRFYEPISQGVTSVFPYIAFLNPVKARVEVQEDGEFICEVCKNIEDYSILHILWLESGQYYTCGFCADYLEYVIRMTLQTLRSARNGEVNG